MTQCNSLNVKLWNSQLNKLKSAIKNEIEGVLRLSSNMTGNNETNFPLILLIFSRDDLPKITDGAYIINLDEYSNIGTHWVALHVNNNNNVTYFDSFGVEHIPKGIK